MSMSFLCSQIEGVITPIGGGYVMSMDWIKECFPKYDIIAEFDNIDEKGDIEVHGLDKQEKAKCLFCGKPYKISGTRGR
jgi:hypothetical protein